MSHNKEETGKTLKTGFRRESRVSARFKRLLFTVYNASDVVKGQPVCSVKWMIIRNDTTKVMVTL